jgi:hypothetical protein
VSCLEPETVAAYVDGRLSADERTAVQAHLAHCDSCMELVAETVHADEALDAAGAGTGATPTVRAFPRRYGLAAAASLLAAAAAVVIVVRVQPAWWERLTGGGADPAIAALVQAVGEDRTVEGRLTGGFPFARLRTPTRAERQPENLSLMAAAADVQKRATEQPTPQNLHAWGVAELLLGDADAAIKTLERARSLENSAPILSDLAAAYIALGTGRRDEEALRRALDAATSSIELAPDRPEPYFNRAVALEGLDDRPGAIDAWAAYLQRDAASPWADEARRRQAALVGSVCSSACEPQSTSEAATIASIETPSRMHCRSG